MATITWGNFISLMNLMPYLEGTTSVVVPLKRTMVFFCSVTEYLSQQPALDPGLKYYICDSTEMVVDTRDILISKGIPFDQIVSEIYF